MNLEVLALSAATAVLVVFGLGNWVRNMQSNPRFNPPGPHHVPPYPEMSFGEILFPIFILWIIFYGIGCLIVKDADNSTKLNQQGFLVLQMNGEVVTNYTGTNH